MTPVAELNEPWAMEFLPDGRLLVTEKRGALKVVDLSGGARVAIDDVSGVPTVEYAGPGGNVQSAGRFGTATPA